MKRSKIVIKFIKRIKLKLKVRYTKKPHATESDMSFCEKTSCLRSVNSRLLYKVQTQLHFLWRICSLQRPDWVDLLSKLAKSIINWGGGLSLTLSVFLFRTLHLAESVHHSLSSLQPSCSGCNLKQMRDWKVGKWHGVVIPRREKEV